MPLQHLIPLRPKPQPLLILLHQYLPYQVYQMLYLFVLFVTRTDLYLNVVIEDLLPYHALGRIEEGGFFEDHLIEDATESPNVGLLAADVVGEELGGHVAG